MSYNYDVTDIFYYDDETYQQTICKLFSMDNYDDETVVQILDRLYFETKDQPLFQVVYNQAASFMLSENQEIGLSVLFSYDNLPLFHKMLVAFHTLDNQFDDSCPAYVELHKKLFS
jgi:hypothetical protein